VDAFSITDGVLHAENVPLPRIAEAVGTPTYVYSTAHLKAQYQRLRRALGELDADVCYAVKANANLAILRLFAEQGAGFDIVSGGELQRVISAGGDPARVIFSGVGKSVAEIDFALKLGIRCFNVESASELDCLSERARVLKRQAPMSIRVNPDVDAGTHPYISTGLRSNKFGIPPGQAVELYRRAQADEYLSVHGIDCHIGSQIGTIDPLIDALRNLLELTDRLSAEGIRLEHVDVGGGLGIRYGDEEELDVEAYGAALCELLRGRELKLLLEPGRYLVGNGGVLLTRTRFLKPTTAETEKNFAVVDAAMNDLIRPALYQAWHEVRPVTPRAGAAELCWDVVGPVCETGDFLAERRELALQEGDLLAVMSAGAYGMVQSSNYNTRPRPAEVLVAGDRFRVVRRRETTRDQLALELEAEHAETWR
jgi:diaminopimelate decarboxylase